MTSRAAGPSLIEIRRTPHGAAAVLNGRWTLLDLSGALRGVRGALSRASSERAALAWDLRAIEALDTTGALILWRAWGRKLPADVRMRERHWQLFEYWRDQDRIEAPSTPGEPLARRALEALAAPARGAAASAAHWLRVLGHLILDSAAIARRPRDAPWRELSATIYLSGAQALPITGLVGLMVGIVVAYLSALLLRDFGANQYIVDMLGYAVIRELGPLMGAALVAGRSGASMTAQIGVMRLAQELDAMTALGIPVSRRLIWPRVTGLIAVMPLIVLWTVLAGLVGGIVVAQLTLGLGLDYFLATMPERVPITNLWIALGKGLAFGAAVALTAAHFGLRIRPNTRDLAAQTTRAVVVAITLVILIDAVFAILLEET